MNRHIAVTILLLTTALTGCKKAFLDASPSSSLVVPSTLTAYQSLLNNNSVMEYTPVLGEVSADNFYLPYSFWQTLDTWEYNAYSWAPDIFEGQGQVGDWAMPYQQVFYANEVLEGLNTIPVTTQNQQQWQNEQGTALFFRAYAFFNVAQLFAPPYDSVTAPSDPGIPLRLTADVTAKSVRASVKATYNQILGDLRQAIPLLPAQVNYPYRNLPCQPAGYALLARICLSMRCYPQAGLYANSALQLYDSLIDYNTVNAGLFYPFGKLNAEVLYQSNVLSYPQCLSAIIDPETIVDSTLYRSYGPGDLRLSLFYTPDADSPNMRPGYAGLLLPFTGLATDECYLIRAECSARNGNTAAALADLNTLLMHRFAYGSFRPVTAPSSTAALDSILLERRKELPFRGLRWSDLRRLNKEGYNITLTRILNGQTFTLPPNSNLYTLPIPPDVISDNPGMIQNSR